MIPWIKVVDFLGFKISYLKDSSYTFGLWISFELFDYYLSFGKQPRSLKDGTNGSN